jgi:hypothetical protein
VLPFENLSEDKANAYFADGIQDEILTRLSKIADLKVISRTRAVLRWRKAARWQATSIVRAGRSFQFATRAVWHYEPRQTAVHFVFFPLSVAISASRKGWRKS